MKKLFCAALLGMLLCAAPAMADPTPVPVVASFSILGDMVKTIGGDAVSVKILVGPNSDTHTYQPTPDDAKTITDAKIVFVNGLGFEGWMQRLIESSGYKGPVVTASNGVNPRTMMDDGAKITDPHAWQDLSNGRMYVRNIAAALEQQIPDQAAAIRARAEKYDGQLADMDVQVKKQFAEIPAAQRKIITSHDAFGYFGAAYGMKVLAPIAGNTEAEPNAADVAQIGDQMKREGIKTIFLENMINPRLVEQLAKDAGAKVGGTLYSDALSAPGEAAPTYLDMFKNNIPKMRAAMLEIGTGK